MIIGIHTGPVVVGTVGNDLRVEFKAENELALAYAGYGRFYKRKGQTVMAREYLMKVLEIFERLGKLIEADRVREGLAELFEPSN